MKRQPISPPTIMRSFYGPELRQRAANLSGLTSLPVRELFNDIPAEIYSHGNDLSIIRKATEEALARVNMSMIRNRDTVNILCSEHGFTLMGGEPYAEMLRTIKDVVQERTGCKNIRLRVSVGYGFNEASEIIKYFKFDQYFKGQTCMVGPFDKGVPIETEIGTLYGIARAYDADWFIHAHYGDIRELYVHRLIDRVLKPFGMSYARLETRGVYHFNFGPRSSNFVQRAIFNSSFIQKKYTFTCFLMVSPTGIIGVDADNDINQLDRRYVIMTLKSYGKLIRLFAEIDECIAVLDGAKWPVYLHAGGITFGNLVYNPKLDYFDLNVIPAGTWFALFERIPGAPKVHGVNPAIKALIINQMWIGMSCTELPVNIPTILVGRDFANMLISDSSNPTFMDYAVTAENLETAMNFARQIAKTDKIILFDGVFGHINLSPSLAEVMIRKAPEVSRNVDETLMPKWLHQRGFDPHQHYSNVVDS